MKHRSRQRGQVLLEFALTLLFVTLVVLAAAGFLVVSLAPTPHHSGFIKKLTYLHQ